MLPILLLLSLVVFPAVKEVAVVLTFLLPVLRLVLGVNLADPLTSAGVAATDAAAAAAVGVAAAEAEAGAGAAVGAAFGTEAGAGAGAGG